MCCPDAGRRRFSVVVATALYGPHVLAQLAGDSRLDGDSNRDRLRLQAERRRRRIGWLATRVHHRYRFHARRVCPGMLATSCLV